MPTLACPVSSTTTQKCSVAHDARVVLAGAGSIGLLASRAPARVVAHRRALVAWTQKLSDTTGHSPAGQGRGSVATFHAAPSKCQAIAGTERPGRRSSRDTRRRPGGSRGRWRWSRPASARWCRCRAPRPPTCRRRRRRSRTRRRRSPRSRGASWCRAATRWCPSKTASAPCDPATSPTARQKVADGQETAVARTPAMDTGADQPLPS